MSTALKTLIGHTGALSDCAWSFDSKSLATASDDCDVFLWEMETGRCLLILSGHSAPVLSCQYSPTDALVASASCDETVRLWDTSTGSCISILPAHADPVTAIHFSKDGTILISTSHDGICRVWDVHTGCCLKSVDLRVALDFVVFVPMSQLVCTVASNGELFLWDLALETCMAHLDRKRKTYFVGQQPCFVKRASSFLVIMPESDSLRIWDMKLGTRKLNSENIEMEQHRESTLLAYNESSERLFMCSSCKLDVSVWVVPYAG